MDITEEIDEIERAYRSQTSKYSDVNSADIELALIRICGKLSGKTALEIEKIVDSSAVSNTSERIVWENIYRKIGKSKYFAKNINCAMRAEYIANKISLDKPVLKIDTFLGREDSYLELNTGAIEHITNHFDEKGYEFVPSRRTERNEENINSLFHLHIPKCGGTSIRNPITHLLTFMHRITRENNFNSNISHILHPIMPRNNYEQEALKKYIDDWPYKIDGAFLSAHGTPWKKLSEMIKSRYNLKSIVLTTLREPRERLLSTIRHEGHDAKSAQDVYKKIKKYPSSFDNTIYRYLNDYELMTDEQYCANEKYEVGDSIDSIIALDTNSRSQVNQIKSKFLSSNRLPNIIQAKRFKDSKDRSKETKARLGDKEINEIYEVCLGKDFLTEDEKIDIIGLSEKSKAKVSNMVKNKLDELHPLTFIISQRNSYTLVDTRDLLSKINICTTKSESKEK